jgi:hypothetical protein
VISVRLPWRVSHGQTLAVIVSTTAFVAVSITATSAESALPT